MIDTDVMQNHIRDANPIPHVENLDTDELTRFVAVAQTRRATAMQAPTQHPTRPTPTTPQAQRRRSVWAFAAAFVVILVVVGAAALLLRNDDTQVTDEPVPTTSIEPTPSTTVAEETTAPFDVESLVWSRVPHDGAVFHPTDDDEMIDVIAAGPGFIAVGQTNTPPDSGWPGDGAVWTSPDGLTWTLLPNDAPPLGGPGHQSIGSITAGGPGFVAVGGTLDGPGVVGGAATVWTSEDGISWSKIPYNEAAFGSKIRPEPGTWMGDVTEGGPGLVAVGTDAWSAAVWTSPDGITWTRVPHDPEVFGYGASWESSSGMHEVIAGGQGLMATGDLDGQAVVWTSPDGLNWSVVPNAPGVGSIAATEDGFVGIGGGESIENACHLGAPGDCTAAVWTSTDGITWNRVPHDEAVFGGGPDKQMMADVTTVGDEVVAVGTSVWASPDGITWSRIYQDPALTGEHEGRMYGVAAGPSNLVVVVGGDGASEYWTDEEGLRNWSSTQSAVVWVGTPSEPPG